MKKFNDYISEDIDSLIQVSPSVADLNKIEGVTDIFSVDVESINIPEPFKNSSIETRDEILELKRIRATGDIEIYKKYDKAFTDDFYQLSDGALSLDRLEYLSEQVAGVVHYFKFKYNRPRPHMLAGYHDIHYPEPVTITGKTPAYPSGHSAQARFVGLFASREDPSRADAYMKLAEEVGYSRLIGGVHYPSDHSSGKLLADVLFDSFKE